MSCSAMCLPRDVRLHKTLASMMRMALLSPKMEAEVQYVQHSAGRQGAGDGREEEGMGGSKSCGGLFASFHAAFKFPHSGF